MVKRIVQYCNITMEVVWLLAVVSIPIYFNIYTSRVFEPDKITLFRSLMLVLSVAWLTKWVAIWAADRAQKASRRTNRKEEAEPSFEPDGDIVVPDMRPFPRRFLLKPLILPVLILVFVYTMATIFSVVPGVSWWGSYQRLQGTYTLTSYVILFMAIAFNMTERRQVERLISFNLLTLIPVALYGFLQHYKADPLPWQGDVVFRVTSTMGNAIFISAYLIMLVPLVIYRLVLTGHWLAVNRTLAQRSFKKGRIRDNALSWLVLYGTFIVFEVGLFFAVLNFTANYRPDNSNLANAQAAAQAAAANPQLIDSKRAVEFSQLAGGDSGGPWWALPIGIILSFGLYFLFTVRRAGTDTNYLFRIFEFLGYLTLAALTVLTILYSQSRGPLMGLMLGLALFPPLLLWRRKMWRWLSGYLVFSLIGGGFLFLFNMPIGTTPLEPLFKIARQNQEIARLGQILETNSGTGKVRQLIWKTDFEIMNNALKNEPWRAFIGYGPESLYNISPPFYQPELAQVEARNAIPDRSHNGYLDALVTTGGLGLLAYVGLVVTFFFYGIKFLRRTNRLDYQVLLAVLMAIMLAHQVEIQVGIQIATTWMLFWISIALMVVLGGLINVSRGIPQMGEVSQQNGTPQANGISQAEPVVTVEEPEPVAALATTSAKSSKTGKQKSRNAQTPPLISESKAASNSPDQLKIKPNRPSIKAASNSSDQLRTKASNAKSKSAAERSSRGTPASNRLVPATEGAFGLGGNVGYSSEYLYRSVRPWFWIAAGAIGIFALTYAYFANYLPIVADGYYKQGTNLGASQNWALAVPYFRKAIEDAPTEDFYYLFLGQAYLEQARTLSADASQLQARKIQITTLFNEGEQALKKAHELAPLNPDHYANLARLYSMWAGADSSRTDEFMTKSVDWYEQVVNSRAPRNARLWTELAASYLNLWASRKDSSNQTLVNKAISAGEQSVKVDDHYDFNRIVLGDIYMSAGKPESAGIHYLKLAEIDANQLNSDSKYTERMRAIAISPQVSNEELVKAFEPIPNGTNQPFRDTTLGAIYYYKDMLSEAEAKLNAALLGDPTNPYNKTYLALIRSKQKRTNEAQALALDAIEQARKVQSNPQLLTIVQQMLSGVLTAQPSATVPNPTIPAGQPTTVTGTTSGASTPTTPLPTKKP